MKINNKEVKGSCFAWNSWNKFYILETKEDIKKVKSREDYKIYDIKLLPKIYNCVNSPLSFINSWDLNTTYATQYEKAKFKEIY